MLRANSFRSTTSWLMEVGAPIVAGALSVALVLAWIVIGASVAAAGSVADELSVNRMLKGDRLHLNPSYPARPTDIPLAPAVDSKLTHGCEPLVSFLADRHLAHIAGRCVS